ncbi:hypothetical protein SADUNF_Sadunf07G0017400 [Salix dunnii]|uniref:BZIP domain-containing protein n=1 Tax=Salix dunnii TaxID=1413687 RepID=A0A835JVK6_9ROSI|nr:hypothetical protein SADUNF_Sadunf07G0017400 [Salix dunnii]
MTPVLCEILLSGFTINSALRRGTHLVQSFSVVFLYWVNQRENRMASSSGASSGSATMLRNSSSEEDLQQVMDTRKRKRMLSNRESARRSRMKKQKHLDDLMGQLGQLSKENNEILTRMNVTSQLYMKIEAENSILRAQMAELSHRLNSLNEIIEHVNFSSSTFERREDSAAPGAVGQLGDDFFMNPWNNANFHLNQPVMDMIMY